MDNQKPKFKKYELICGLETEHNIFFKFKNKKINDEETINDINDIKNVIEEIIIKEIDKEINFIKDCRNSPIGGFSAKNTGRFYPDIGDTIEAATPECPTIKDLVLHHHVQESILTTALKRTRKENLYVTLLKETSDRNGQTLGSHESFYIPIETISAYKIQNASALPDAILKDIRKFTPYLIPFLMIRPLICGGGKISKEIPRALEKYGANNIFEDKFSFQISQRNDYITKIIQRTSPRQYGFFTIKPEVNFNNPENFCKGYRLHIASGDSNRCPLSLFLRMGSTALVIKTWQENGFKDLPPEIVDKKLLDYFSKQINKSFITEKTKVLKINKTDMAKPFIDLAILSRDTDLKHKFKTQDNKEFTALEIHLWYLQQIKNHLVSTGQFESEYKEIWEVWNDTVQTLIAGDLKKLFGIVDWVTLKLALDCIAKNKSLTEKPYENPEIRKLEASYFNLDDDPSQSLFSLLKNKRKIKMLFGDAEIENGKNSAPRSRADFRKFLIDSIRKYFGEGCKNINNIKTVIIEEIEWNNLKFFVYFTGYEPKKSEICGIISPGKRQKPSLLIATKINPFLRVCADYKTADRDTDPKIYELRVVINMETPCASNRESYHRIEQIIKDLSRLAKKK